MGFPEGNAKIGSAPSVPEFSTKPQSDENGSILPLDVENGTYTFRDLDHVLGQTLYEGKLTIDKKFGHASYGCGFCCDPWANTFLSPSQVSAGVGNSWQFGLIGWGQCGNDNVDLSGNIYSWGGGSSAVASVSGTGWATAVGPGSITMWGFLRAPGTTYKCPYQIKQPTSTPVRVGPTITSISPQTGEQGTAVPVVISGSGFGTSPTVTTTAGSVSGVTSNGSTINATFTISSGKATGNYTVVVTNTNQATTSFFVTAQCSPTVSTTDQLRSCDGHTVYQGILTIGGANEANVTDTLVSASSDNTITVETQGSPYKYSTFCPPGSICYDEDYIGFHNNMYPSAHINWNVQIFCSNSPYPSQTITRSETVTCQ